MAYTGGDQESAYIGEDQMMAGIGWAAGLREDNTDRAVGSLGSESGTEYWGSGESTGSGNFRG
jgi:hypothetical protein